jgi:DNA-binding response OmpR family regulator
MTAVSRGRAIAREELLQRVWGLDPRGIETRTVDMHVARLREKLHDPPQAARIIVTVRGKGYMLGEGVEVME